MGSHMLEMAESRPWLVITEELHQDGPSDPAGNA